MYNERQKYLYSWNAEIKRATFSTLLNISKYNK